jgi:UDP-N-acetylmuramoyl-tripeptide--D-alanyl-D-alanine ligase
VVGGHEDCELVEALAARAAEGFGQAAEQHADIAAATAAAESLLGPDTTILVKASRSVGLDRLVRALAASEEAGAC